MSHLNVAKTSRERVPLSSFSGSGGKKLGKVEQQGQGQGQGQGQEEEEEDIESTFVHPITSRAVKSPIIIDWGSYQIKLGTMKDKIPNLSVESAMAYVNSGNKNNKNSSGGSSSSSSNNKDHDDDGSDSDSNNNNNNNNRKYKNKNKYNSNNNNTLVGAQALKMHRDYPEEITLQTPLVNKGSKFDWECVDTLTEALLWDGLELESIEHPVFITHRHLCSETGPANSKSSNYEAAKKFMELYFETYENPKLYITTSNLLSLYGSGITNGLVVEGGHHGCTITPVITDGVISYEHIFATHDYYGGYDVTKYFMKYLKSDYIDVQQSKAERDSDDDEDDEDDSPNQSENGENSPHKLMMMNDTRINEIARSPYQVLQGLQMYDWPTLEYLKHRALFVVKDYAEVEKNIMDIRNQLFFHEYVQLYYPECYYKEIIQEILSWCAPVFGRYNSFILPDKKELLISSYTHPSVRNHLKRHTYNESWKNEEEEGEGKGKGEENNHTKSSNDNSHEILLGYERFEPCEILFQPWRYYNAQSLYESGFSSYLQKNLVGLDTLIMQTYYRCGAVPNKHDVVLSGGNMLLPGLYERLKFEVRNKHKYAHSNVRGMPNILQPNDPQFLPYIGANVLMSLDLFDLSSSTEWIDINDHLEEGPERCISKRIFQ